MNGAAAPRKNSLISQSRWNLIAFACGLVAQFVTLPFVVRWIGLADFGRAGLVLAVCAPLMLIGTVLGQATTREAASRQDEPADSRRVIAAALWMCLIASIVGFVFLLACGPLLLSGLTEDSMPMPGLRTAFAIAATGWAAQQVALVLQGSTASRQDFRTLARVAAFGSAASVLLTLAATHAFPTRDGYLAGVAASMVATLLAWLVGGRSAGNEATPWPRWHKAEAMRLLAFSRWQGLAQFAGALGNQIDRYVLGALAPAALVGQYNAANRLQEAAYMGVMKGGEILFPHFGATASAGRPERESFFITASWVTGTLSVVFLAPLVPLAHSLLALWAGPPTADGGAVLLRTLVLGGIIGCGSNVFSYYAMGTGQNRPLALLSVAYSALTIVATVALMARLGPYAAGAGLLVASVFRVAASLVLTRRLFFPGLDLTSLAVSTPLPLMCGCAVALAFDASGLGIVSSWLELVFAYAAIAATVLLTTTGATSITAAGRCIVGRVRAGLTVRPATKR